MQLDRSWLPSCKFRGELAEKWLSSTIGTGHHRSLLMAIICLTKSHCTTIGISRRWSMFSISTTSSWWCIVVWMIRTWRYIMDRLTIRSRALYVATLVSNTRSRVSRRCKCWVGWSRCSRDRRIGSSRSLYRDRTTKRDRQTVSQADRESENWKRKRKVNGDIINNNNKTLSVSNTNESISSNSSRRAHSDQRWGLVCSNRSGAWRCEKESLSQAARSCQELIIDH